MTTTMPTATIPAVFAAAAHATAWTRTNLGKQTEITHEGQTWTVLLPEMTKNENGEPEPTKARITQYQGRGGDVENVDVEATWGQTMLIVDAAVCATRVL